MPLTPYRVHSCLWNFKIFFSLLTELIIILHPLAKRGNIKIKVLCKVRDVWLWGTCGTLHLCQLSIGSSLCGSRLITYSYWHLSKPCSKLITGSAGWPEVEWRRHISVESTLAPHSVCRFSIFQSLWAPWTLPFSHWYGGHLLPTL